MIRIVLALCVLLPAAAWAQSPFAGTWRGGWSDGVTGQSGPAALVVGEDGGIDGQVGNRVLGAFAPVSGHVEPDGFMALTYTYDGGRTFMRAAGRMRVRNGRLTGTLDFFSPGGGRIGRGSFRLRPAAQDG